jgi:hypothetical protein
MLSAPTFVVWLISTVLAIAVACVYYLGISIPVIGPFVKIHLFSAMVISYVLLWLGTVLKGL